MRGKFSFGCCFSFGTVLLVATLSTRHRGPGTDARRADLADGMRLFPQKKLPSLPWLGRGRAQDGQPDAGRANLRESVLDRADLIMADQMRAPGRRDAGIRQARLQRTPMLRHEAGRLKSRQLTVAGSTGPVAAREIELLADFLFAKIVRKGPWITPSASILGSDVEACGDSRSDDPVRIVMPA